MPEDWNRLIWQELKRIADSLERIAPDPISEPEPEPSCPHPQEARMSFGMTNGQPDWLCTLCQYRTPCLPLDPAMTTPDPERVSPRP